MFYYVDGTVSVLQQGLAVIDCGGVGYACHASQNTIGKLKTGEKARLLTWLNVREGVFELYGFIDEEEKSCFLMLTSVNGVGPKAALSILSVAPPDRLALSIITGDEKMLMQAPGIGKKIAQRIVLELRDKMSKEQLETASAASPVAGSRRFRRCQPHAGGSRGAHGARLYAGRGTARNGGSGCCRHGGGRDHPSVLEKAGQVLILDDKSLIK